MGKFDRVSKSLINSIMNGEEPVFEEVVMMANEINQSRLEQEGSGQPCAWCGDARHTPLRRDDMGGYVCLRCVNDRLDNLASMTKRLSEALPYGRW